MSSPRAPRYLEPYLAAVRRQGPGFKSLLWASRQTQAKRFDALTRLCDFNGKTILDVGCGHADLLDYLVDHGIEYAEYRGLEMLEEFIQTAQRKPHPRAVIHRGDFVTEPAKLFVAADVVVFSGSLNTLDAATFYEVLRRAFDATAGEVVFNYLDSDTLANARYLTWHRPEKVKAFAWGLAADVREVGDYMEGDRTVWMSKG